MTGWLDPDYWPKERPKLRLRPGFKIGRGNAIVRAAIPPKTPTREQLFRAYCDRVAKVSVYRAKALGVPHDIDGDYIEGLLIEQCYACAITWIRLQLPPTGMKGAGLKQVPFGPSLDRIRPSEGYVRGNVRITCSIVNMAMNEWGEEAFGLMARAFVATERDRRRGYGTIIEHPNGYENEPPHFKHNLRQKTLTKST